MIKSVSFANAATVVIAILYVVCALVSYAAPDFIFGLAESWVHSLSLKAVRAQVSLSLGSLVYGLVTISALTWVVAYAVIELYNRFAKK